MENKDYLAHARTPGSKNGVSTTPGYDAIGKPAMSEAERKARRLIYEKQRRQNEKSQKKDNNIERNPFTQAGKGFKNSISSLSDAVDIMWRPRGKANKLSQYRTRDIEEMNRRARAIEEYYGHYPTRAQRGKDITLGILAGIGSLGMATLSGIAIVSTLKGMKS